MTTASTFLHRQSGAKKNKNSSTILWRALQYLHPYRFFAIGMYVTLIFINLLNVIIPQFVRWIVDEGIIGQNTALLGWSVLGLLGATLARGVFVFFQGQWSEVASQSVAYDLRNQIQGKLTELSFSFHDHSETGQILSRAIQDVERIRFLTGRALLRILDGILLLLGTSIVLIWMNPLLGILTTLTAPFLVHRAYVFAKTLRPLSLEAQNQLGNVTTRLEQNLRGARAVKSFAQEEVEIERFSAENEKWFGISARAVRLEAVNTSLLDLISNLGTVIVLWAGGMMVARGEISLGVLIAFTTYLGQLYRPIRQMGRVIPILSIAASAGERIFEILDARSEVEDRQGAVDLPPIQGRVRFDEVSFGYGGPTTVLEKITFEVQPGQVVALLGPTGSGKSSVVNLLARFYEPSTGKITIDGYDIQDITLHSLRSQLAIVMQETTLFAASLRDNILFAKPGATEDELIAAASQAQIHAFITSLPDGYNSKVGERGIMLSGGQKQRIAIARAILADARILILDDATSSVDTQTEQEIQLALSNLMEARTTFVIAHRLSTVRRADIILVLDRGQIMAQGTHEALLKSSPVYQEIYNLQLRPLEETGETL